MALAVDPRQPPGSALGVKRDPRRVLERVSSSKRIDSAGGAAAGPSLSQKLESRGVALGHRVRHLNDAVSAVRVAADGLGRVSERLDRMHALAASSGKGAPDDPERASLQREYDELAAEITRVAESTEFAGRRLLDGGPSGANAIALQDGTDGEEVEVSIGSLTAAGLGLEGSSLSDPGARDAIEGARERVSRTRAQLGSLESLLSSRIGDLRAGGESAKAARSRIADLGHAQATAQQTRNEILQQIQLALRGQANASAGAALHLLR